MFSLNVPLCVVDFLEKSEDKEGNALAFHFLSGPRVTVMASKTSREYTHTRSIF